LHGIREGQGRITVLTGAGISAESGIPTFRGKEGYWTVGSRNCHPEELATASAFRRFPDEVWRWYLYRRSICRRAEPNSGHRALVDLEHAAPGRFTLVTQNVDGLHLRAGQDPRLTLQIHGCIDFMRCAGRCCNALHPIPAAIGSLERDDPLPPEHLASLVCPHCRGAARPHVLWFDECYDEELFFAESAVQAVAGADVLIVVGTAGATNLPLQLGSLAARLGCPIIDINLADGPFSTLAQRSGGHALRGAASQLLPALVAELG
jgi:NAD-dependent deacetylase